MPLHRSSLRATDLVPQYQHFVFVAQRTHSRLISLISGWLHG
jgi:hypothetical protein